MVVEIEERKAQIEELCRRYRVRTLYVFGSAVRDALTDESDIDFLVDFEPVEPAVHFEHYFGLLEALEGALERPVDLVEASAIDNPYFLEAVEETKVMLYAA